MKKLKIAVFAIVAGIVAAIMVPGSSTSTDTVKNEPEPIVETHHSTTNNISQTNQTDRGKATYYGTEWFKDSSNYIWDGWKIK